MVLMNEVRPTKHIKVSTPFRALPLRDAKCDYGIRCAILAYFAVPHPLTALPGCSCRFVAKYAFGNRSIAKNIFGYVLQGSTRASQLANTCPKFVSLPF
jgi:hypothetical protein